MEGENTVSAEEEKKGLYGGYETALEWIHSLAQKEGLLQSPINISLSFAMPLDLDPLEWQFLDTVPKKVKLTNTGRSLQISASWYNEKPVLRSGPFESDFVFSQLHFHWGTVDMEGSEHNVDGVQYPLEMHVVFFKNEYVTHEEALKQKDGVAVLVYLFKLHAETNIVMNYVLSKLSLIRQSVSSTRLSNIPLQYFLRKFDADYFLYWGSVVTTTKTHTILWLIPRESMGITLEQMECFRTLFNIEYEPLISNFRKIQPLGKRHLFHISPSTIKYASMLPVPMPDVNALNDLEALIASK